MKKAKKGLGSTHVKRERERERHREREEARIYMSIDRLDQVDSIGQI